MVSQNFKHLSLDIQTLSAQYQSGKLTPIDVINIIYERITAQASNPIWIELLPLEKLRQAAALLAKQQNQHKPLPLFGIPFAVKDNIDVAGLPTTAACPAYQYTPPHHATVVKQLLDAGALLIGKTNLDQFATGLVGVRSPYGACRNSFDPDYISGGSSSGSALAVAMGMVSFALGTDTAGSGRVPAAFNNIIGLKPTRGLLSTFGVVPACRSLDCVSIFALTCADASNVLQIVQGFDDKDCYSRPAPNAKTKNLAKFRFGVPAADQLAFFGDRAYQNLYAQSLERLEAIGGQRVEIDFAPFQAAAQLLYDGAWVVERHRGLADFFRDHADQVLPVIQQILAGAERYTASDVFANLEQLEALKQKANLEWQKMDFLALPTAGTIYKIQDIEADPMRLNTNLGYYTNFVNLMDLAAIALPSGFREDGLPFGITLIAPAFQEDRLGHVGDSYHQKLGGNLGATSLPMPANQPMSLSSSSGSANSEDTIQVAVVGAHLSGQPLNYQLSDRGAQLVKATRTAPLYKLFALANTQPPKPGLMRINSDTDIGYAIEVEVWEMPVSNFGSFVAEIPSPLGIGTLQLETKEFVKGFICEAYAISGAAEISSYGSWRAYLASLL